MVEKAGAHYKKKEKSPRSVPVLVRRIADFIMRIVSDIPVSTHLKSRKPADRARALVTTAAMQSAALSGTLALPSGPLALVTVLPDLVGIWRLQAKLVADIAAIYGKEAYLSKEAMIYCLFKHVASQVVRDITVRVGERAMIQQVSLQALPKIATSIGGKLAQRITRKSVARWFPVIGAVGVAGYAYYDTFQVGQTATELFSRKISGLLEYRRAQKKS